MDPSNGKLDLVHHWQDLQRSRPFWYRWTTLQIISWLRDTQNLSDPELLHSIERARLNGVSLVDLWTNQFQPPSIKLIAEECKLDNSQAELLFAALCALTDYDSDVGMVDDIVQEGTVSDNSDSLLMVL